MGNFLGVENFGLFFVASAFTAATGSYASRLSSSLLNTARLKAVLSFGTGYLLALGILELIPHCYRFFRGSLQWTGGAVMLGVFAVILIEKIFNKETLQILFGVDHSQNHEHSHNKRQDHAQCCNISSFEDIEPQVIYSAITCIFICTFFDGVSLASVMMVSPSLGLMTLVGQLMHILPEVVLVGILSTSTLNSKTSQYFCIVAPALFLLGSLLSHFIYYFGVSQGVLLGVSGGVIVYISLRHLIPKFTSNFREASFIGGGAISFLIVEIFHYRLLWMK